MELEILSLVFSYANGKRELDQNYFKEIISIAQKYIQGYDLKGVKFFKESPNIPNGRLTLAAYDQYSKYVNCYVNRINKYITLLQDRYKDIISDDEMSVFVHLELAYLMLHEFYHSTEDKIRKLDICDLEKAVVSICRIITTDEKSKMLKDGLSEYDIGKLYKERANLYFDIYYKNYNYAPNERRAAINGYDIITKAATYIKNEYPNVLNYLLAKIQCYKFRGYEKDNINGIDVVKSPTVMFVEDIYRNGVRDYIPFDWYDENINTCLNNVKSIYSFDERFQYGLPIDYEEYSTQYDIASKNDQYIKHS